MARAVLLDAFAQRQPICVFEVTSRTPSAIAVSLVIPLLVLALTPAVRPVSPFQILFTYLVPVLPLLIFWDCIASQLRTYSALEFETLTADFTSLDYVWQQGFIDAPGVPFRTCYLMGRRKM
jgi:hypothetical protein